MSHVLIVDDEPSICWGFQELLSDDGHEVSACASAEEALQSVKHRRPDAVLLDIRLPGLDGLSAMNPLREEIGEAPIILITAFGDLETAVRAMDEGAFDYLPKPFDLDAAAEVIRRALRTTLPAREEPHLPQAAPSPDNPLVGSSAAMQTVFKQIALASTSDVPVLITGESGTGKELVAQAIHRHSRRRNGPFVPICLGALSESVIESELFGHLKGAFTGAEVDRTGLLEQSHRGTVLLDEIGDVPLSLQVKLLRAIEQREILPVGSARPRQTDFRVLAAANRSLPDLISAGRFREDLYYRLGVFQIELPPLRRRVDDIPQLAEFFLRRLECDEPAQALSAAALRELASRPWPGNVRELRHVIEHAAVVSRGGTIEPEHLPPRDRTDARTGRTLVEQLRREVGTWTEEELQQAGETDALHQRLLEAVEPELLRRVLVHCRGNRAAAARLLGLHRATLRERMRRYQLDD